MECKAARTWLKEEQNGGLLWGGTGAGLGGPVWVEKRGKWESLGRGGKRLEP